MEEDNSSSDNQGSSGVNDNHDIDKDDKLKGLMVDEDKSDKRSLKKSATFPYSSDASSSDASEDDDEDEEDDEDDIEANFNHTLSLNPDYKRAISLPPLPSEFELKSAMKGSREKLGGEPRRLSWAPDVYDPKPSLLSHTVRSTNQQMQRSSKGGGKSRKKKGKNKDKGGGSGSKKSKSGGSKSWR